MLTFDRRATSTKLGAFFIGERKGLHSVNFLQAPVQIQTTSIWLKISVDERPQGMQTFALRQ
jgi:hypothetical protein